MGNRWENGIYHYSNEGRISWFEFAAAICDIKQIDSNVLGIPASSYPAPAERPMYSLLDKRKIQQAFGVQVPEWKSSLIDCLNKLQNTR